MRYYLVGTPESVFTEKFFFSLKHNFTREEIALNLKRTRNLRLFTKLHDAYEYARSLRVCRSFAHPPRKKFAPVVYVDLELGLDEFNKNQQTQEVIITVYDGMHDTYSKEHRKRNSKITFMPLSGLHFDVAKCKINAVKFPDTDYRITQFKQTAPSLSLPFFRALNPTSKHSGIVYTHARDSQGNDLPMQGTEMLDTTVGETIYNAFISDLDFLSGLSATFTILVGEHFEVYLNGDKNYQGGTKGILDFLILPLVARKLLADADLEESILTKILAWAIAVPIEIARLGVGFGLTLLLSPVVALVHVVRACLPNNCDNHAILLTNNSF